MKCIARHGIILAGLLILLGMGRLTGQEATPTHSLARITQAPVIDGDLADACWHQVAPVYLRHWPGGREPDLKTAVRVATDGTWLYFAYECEDPTPQFPEKRSYLRDTLSTQDKVELFLEPKRGSNIYLHFLISPAGEQSDQKCTIVGEQPQRDRYFNPHWRCMGRKTARGWAIEAAIPLFYLQDMAGPEATEWGVNFTREEHVGRGRVFYSWAVPTAGFHEPQRFGILQEVPQQRGAAPFAPVLVNVESGAGQWFGSPDQYRGTDKAIWVESEAQGKAGGVFVYPAKIWLANEGGVGGSALMRLEFGPNRKPVEWEMQLGPGESLEKEITLGVRGEYAEPVVNISAEDALGPWQVAMANFGGRPQAIMSKIDAYPDRSFYTTEKEAKVYFSVDYPAAQLSKHSLTFAIQSKEGKTLWEKGGVRLAEGENVLTIPLIEMPNGRHTLQVTLWDGSGKRVDQMDESFVKLPTLGQGNEVKVDRYNRCVLVNGKPFFPFGIIAMGILPQIPKHHEEGFNSLFRWGAYYRCVDGKTSPEEAGQSDPLLEEAQKYGMKVIDATWLLVGPGQLNYASPNFVTNYEGIWKERLFGVLPIVKHHPAYIATCWGDEPSDWTVQPGSRRLRDLARQGIDWIHALDGYHPAFYNFAGIVPAHRQWTDNNDLYSAYSGSCGQELARFVRQANESAERDHKALWYMPKIEIPFGAARTVPREDKAKAYIVMVHGAAGMYYFMGGFPGLVHRDTRAGVMEWSKEIYALAPAILRRPPKQTITYSGLPEEKIKNHEYAVALALRTFPDETPVLIFVNKENYAVDCTCRLPWLPSGARLVSMFGPKQRPSLKNKAFSEKLEGLATRAYRIEGYRIQDTTTEHIIQITEKHPKEAIATGPRELLENPGFEQDGYWTVSQGKDKSPYKVGMAPEGEAHSGKHCVKLERKADDPQQNLVSPVIHLQPNRRYQFSIWWKQETPEWPKYADGRTWHYSGLDAHVQLVDAKQKDTLPPDSRLPGLAAGMKHRNWQAHNTSPEFTTGEQPVEVVVNIRNLSTGTVWVDDVSLKDLGPRQMVSKSRNLIHNSSFETARLRGWPDYALPRPTVYHTMDYLGYDDSPWRQDATYAYHGKYSLLTKQSTIRWTDLNRYAIAVKEGQDYTFSAYLRSDQEGVRVKIIVDGVGEQVFEVGTEWKRYWFTGVRKRPATQQVALDRIGQIRIESLGSPTKDKEATLWIDAMQFEEGKQPTPYVDDGYLPEYPVWND